MNIDEKIEFFNLLVKLGFKEIEVGFPSASQIEYDFLRRLIDENYIPDDVVVQVLTQARPHLIEKTFEALKGVKQAIVHIYNSTSVLQRDVVFNMSKEEIKKIAIEGTGLVKKYSSDFEGKIFLEYSPESFRNRFFTFFGSKIRIKVFQLLCSDEKDIIRKKRINIVVTSGNVFFCIFQSPVDFADSILTYQRLQSVLFAHQS